MILGSSVDISFTEETAAPLFTVQLLSTIRLQSTGKFRS